MLERATDLVRRLVEPLLRFNLLDRSLALAAQAFSAVIPLLIIVSAAQPGDRSLADGLISRFHLTGAAADTLRRAFTPPSGGTTVTALSVLLLIVSTLSFTRRLQRLYEESWGLSTRGLRGTGAGLAWIAALALYGTLHPLLGRELRHDRRRVRDDHLAVGTRDRARVRRGLRQLAVRPVHPERVRGAGVPSAHGPSPG